MAEIYDLNAYRAARPAQEAPVTRNQQILAEIQARWAARTPEEILAAEINGTQEELQAEQRRSPRALEARERLPSPADIAHSQERPQMPEPGHEKEPGREW
jgi:hypothetical protein